MSRWIEIILSIIAILLFINAFYWVADVHAFLDQHYWHLDHVDRGEVLLASFFGFFLTWLIAFLASMLPYMLTAALLWHFSSKRIEKENAKLWQIEQAKKASNLYIKTNVSSSMEA